MSEQNMPIALLEDLYFTWSKKRAISIEPLARISSLRIFSE